MVKKVATECYKLEREASFKNSKPVQLLNELLGKKNDEKVENVDWEDVFLLSDENDEEWPSKTLGFKETMKEYRTELKKLGHKVMEIMDENLGLPKGYIKNAFDGGVDNSAFFGTKATIAPAPQLLGPKVENKASDATKYPKFVFGDYMSVYLEQKFQPKEPRFQAVKAV
ncbi:UNVERIFIED_CONTAM: 1-aminocyclopropane-1-carboxylate oxidase 5 [Sesamum latifolium]|uniref:1-aminocyclopropane-1-carboxylate oxidase 5 n=1 Tax=Sesamum latifolium TaxID=2727402 RepID=A0AAW2VGD4_9LAMI